MARSAPRHARIPSRLGDLDVAVCGSGADAVVSGVWFEDHRTPPGADDLGVRIGWREDPLLTAVHEQVTAYLDGRRGGFSLPSRPAGSAFQHRVWAELGRIPRGATCTYGEIATQLGVPAQAVGGAVGANPLSIVAPCHRVVGSDGSLVGYAGGVARKRALLALEEPAAADAARLF